MIELLNIDCNEFMKTIPDNYFQLAIVDPPYGINAPNMQMGSHPNRKEVGHYPGTSVAVKLKKKHPFNQGCGKLKNRSLNSSTLDWDNNKPTEEYFKELFRVSVNQVIWGGNYFDLPPTRGIYCWNKNQPWNNFSQFELAWTSFDIPAKLFTKSNRGGRNNEEKIHPTQKPVSLYRDILQHFANENDKIFDSHAGSGSLALACFELKLDYVGCEIDHTYHSSALQRINNHVNDYAPVTEIPVNRNGQLKLF